MRLVRSGMAAILLSMMAIIVSACASQIEPDPYTNRPACPGDRVLQCVETTSQVAKCGCVPRADMQETIESIMGGDRSVGGKRRN